MIEVNKKDLSQNTESYIIHLLEVRTKVSVQELCDTFALAPSTIRKKLAEMEKKGLLIRTHGGAISIDANRDEPMDKKSMLNIPQKKAIASVAMEFVTNGNTIALGGGSRVAELCVYLLKLKDSLILTDSIIVANLVMQNRSLEVRINSGIVRGRTGCVVGPNSSDLFHEYEGRVDKAFVGCDAFNLEDGACSANILVGEVERDLLLSAKERYILCDSTKLDKTTVTPFIDPHEITALITDDEADPYYVSKLRENGVEVYVAPIFRTRQSFGDRG